MNSSSSRKFISFTYYNSASIFEGRLLSIVASSHSYACLSFISDVKDCKSFSEDISLLTITFDLHESGLKIADSSGVRVL